MNPPKFVDVEKIIGSKNPRLLKWMPGFLLRYIKRIVHEREVNEFMAKYGHLRDFDFIRQVIEFMRLTVVVKGLENLPENGGFILAANHPLGGLDGIALMHAVGQKRKDIRFLVNDILLYLGTMDSLFVPVNKHGGQYAKAKIEEAYGSENAILIFPSGLVSRKNHGMISDLEWKKSFIVKSQQYKQQVVPCFIDGKNSNWFYNLSLWRRRFGIKANIEMFYLADEMFKQRDHTITIIFGKPIPSSGFTQVHNPKQWAAKMKEHVYNLGAGKKELFAE
jgi:1-acyl-sn-glycerol-3-phosphate acyltransferase